MTDFICKKCGSTEYEIKDKTNGTGIAHGLYCAKCGFWHKWLNKQELILYDKKDSKDEIIARLEAENAELKARLDKAVELPYMEKCNEYTKIIYKNSYGDIEDETYFHDCFYGENKNIRGDIYAEARLAELKK